MDRGYVRLWRKSIDGGLIKNHNVWVFWTWCLMKANHKKKHKQTIGFQEVFLQPGEFIFGRKMASNETGLSEQTIRTCLSFLKKSKNLTIKSTNKFSILFIVNWDTYQHIEKETNQQINQHVTSNQPASNHKQEHKNNKTKELKDIYSYISTDIIEFCLSFIDYIKKEKDIIPSSKDNLKNSAETIDKLIRIDEFSLAKIKEVIKWAVKDDFWESNLYSLASLRKKSSNSLTKFQNIVASYDRSKKGVNNKSGFKTRDEKNREECEKFIYGEL